MPFAMGRAVLAADRPVAVTRLVHLAALQVPRAIEAGRVWVNCYHAYPAHAPFGGYKQSGFGRGQCAPLVRVFRPLFVRSVLWRGPLGVFVDCSRSGVIGVEGVDAIAVHIPRVHIHRISEFIGPGEKECPIAVNIAVIKHIRIRLFLCTPPETHKMMLNHYRQTKNMLISLDKNKLGFF